MHLTFTSAESDSNATCVNRCCSQTPEEGYGCFANVQEYWPVKIASRGSKPINYLHDSSSNHVRDYVENDPLPKWAVSDDVRKRLGHDNDRLFTTLELLNMTKTDAFVVMHKDKIVYEKYFNQSENNRHMMNSCTKSYIGLVAAMLVHDDKLDPNGLVVDYIPELVNVMAFQNATVRHLMDMSIAIDYDESKYGPNSGDAKFHNALHFGSTHDFIKKLQPHQNRSHGDAFEYISPVTDTLGWVIDNALGGNGKTIEYFEKNIWSKLGQEHDLLISMFGQTTFLANYDRGAAATARDMMRFGQMMANMGKTADGIQIVHPDVVKDILKGGTDENVEQYKNSREHYDGLTPTVYRNQFRVYIDQGVILQSGIHGQHVLVDTKRDLVVVKQSTNEDATNMFLTEYSLINLLSDSLPISTGKSAKSNGPKSKGPKSKKTK